MGMNNPKESALMLAIILLAFTIIVRYIIGRRRFNRRNSSGMQSFRNYSQAVLVTFLERVFMILSTLAFIGSVFFFLAYFA